MGKSLREFIKGITIGDVVSIFGAAISLIALFQSDNLRESATIWLFGFYIFILASFLVWREFVYSRKARYAEASASLHRCAHIIRDAHDAANRNNKELVENKIRDVLVAFAETFSLIAGASCRACIKSIVANTDLSPTEFLTETLARSDTTGRTLNDDLAPIKDNTDFWLIFTGKQNIYICDDLSKENPYNNSNWPSDPNERQRFIKDRKFKYITTIVWPIRNKIPSNSEPQEVVGFLCVDSLTRGIFERRYDLDLGSIVADTLYPLLVKYREISHPQPTIS